jgi:hypothetical protein
LQRVKPHYIPCASAQRPSAFAPLVPGCSAAAILRIEPLAIERQAKLLSVVCFCKAEDDVVAIVAADRVPSRAQGEIAAKPCFSS